MDLATSNKAVITFNIDFSSALSDIFTMLDDLRKLLQDDWVEDSYEEDSIAREKRRAVEFSRTITRNILFPLHGQICKLENETIAFQADNNEGNNYERSDTLRNLLMCICRSIKRAIQNYLRFVRGSIVKDTPKMVCLLSYIVQVYEISAIIVQHKALHIYNLTDICCEVMKLNVRSKQSVKCRKNVSKEIQYQSTGKLEHCSNCFKRDTTWEPVATREGVKYLCINKKEANNIEQGDENKSKRNDGVFEHGNKLKEKVIRVCDEICDSLTSEITADVSQWMHQLAASILYAEFK